MVQQCSKNLARGLALILLTFSTSLCAQDQDFKQIQHQIDSLNREFTQLENDTLKGQNRILIADLYRAFNLDKGVVYVQQAFEILQNNPKWLSEAYSSMGLLEKDRGNFDQAMQYHLKALQIRDSLYKLTPNKNTGSYLAASNLNVGEIFNANRDFKDALIYYQKALELDKQYENLEGYAATMIDIGVIHYYNQDHDASIEAYMEAYRTAEKLGDLKNMGLAMNNIGFTYEFTERADTALIYYEKAYEHFQQLDNKNFMAAILTNIGSVYSRLGDARAEATLLKSVEIAEEINSKPRLSDAYETLKEHYHKTGNFEKAYSYLNQFNDLSTHLLNEQQNEKIAEMAAKYESHQKDLELLEQQSQIEQDKIQRNALIAIALLILVFLAFVARSLVIKRKDNRLLQQQKERIEEANEELNQYNEEILAQRDQIESQREALSQKNEEITSSINYARRIQEAILPSMNAMQHALKDGFVLYMPKDVVAGDFYWMETFIPSRDEVKKGHSDAEAGGEDKLDLGVGNKLVYVAAADCTGHGVPGAMVSVVCSNALSKALLEEHCVVPGQLLDRTREIVVKRLVSEETLHEGDNIVRDGMDISLCAIDYEQSKLYWAGANNPIYILRNNPEPNVPDDQRIEIIKGNRESVGYTRKYSSFTTHEIKVEKGDTIYLFSDGFADQFGGPKGGKFGYKKFRALLATMSGMEMNQQKEHLETSAKEWMEEAGESQIDDICVIGIRF